MYFVFGTPICYSRYCNDEVVVASTLKRKKQIATENWEKGVYQKKKTEKKGIIDILWDMYKKERS